MKGITNILLFIGLIVSIILLGIGVNLNNNGIMYSAILLIVTFAMPLMLHSINIK